MLSRTARVSHHLPPCGSSLNQQLITRFASTEAADATVKVAARPSAHLKAPPIRTAFVKSWKPAHNIAEQWLIIRAIEKKYGKILETHFLKDYEDIGKYQMMSYIVFDDPKSLEHIPETGVDMTIPSQPDDRLSHEIGLEDVEHLAPYGTFATSIPEETQEVPPADSEEKPVTLGFRIHRAKMDYISEKEIRHPLVRQETNFKTARAFHAWGGFANLDPLEQPRSVWDAELYSQSGVNDQLRMRASLQLCERLARVKGVPILLAQTDKSPSQESSPSGTETISKSSTHAAAPASTLASTVDQEPVANSSTLKSTAAKSETPKTATQPKQEATSKEAASNKTTAQKSAVSTANAKSPTPQTSQAPAKEAVGSKPPKYTPIKLPPAIHETAADGRRKQPKPKIKMQALSKSSPISPSSYSKRAAAAEETDAEPAPAEEAPSVLTKFWGMLTGRRK